MNRRMYFVLPDVETAQQVEHDLLLARIEERRMHFLGRRGTDLKDLPEPSNAQKSDLRHGMYVGLVAGVVTGAILGTGLYAYPDLIGIPVNPGAILLLAAFGAVLGVFVSGPLIGSSTPNVHLKEFDKDFEQGRIVLILDIPKDRVDEIRTLIKGHFPAAEDHGVEPTMPAFP
ncbi:MAG: DUF1269 domain-containing protein [Pseudomonadota bacterium]|nr:DUF1269 domain-containing protein [Pseudomonadota bacterium]